MEVAAADELTVDAGADLRRGLVLAQLGEDAGEVDELFGDEMDDLAFVDLAAQLNPDVSWWHG